jgi:hypothetical protein
MSKMYILDKVVCGVTNELDFVRYIKIDMTLIESILIDRYA